MPSSGLIYQDAPPGGLTVLDPRTPPHRRLGLRFFGGVLAGTVLMVPVLAATEHYFLLGDDSARGERYAELVRQSLSDDTAGRYIGKECARAAEALYGHPVPGDFVAGDYPPPAEKAFYVACSGRALDGIGGGLGRAANGD